jgi:hypothetical protein
MQRRRCLLHARGAALLVAAEPPPPLSDLALQDAQ